jgi:hypothetical protein
MRLWTIHPKYLDGRGLVTAWREALLARAVLRGQTRGYRHHPQLHRFLECPSPRSAINAYLSVLLDEADARGYAFDRGKVGPVRERFLIPTSAGQLDYEWRHFLGKLHARNPALHERWRGLRRPEPHPLFHIRPGAIEPWERVREE